MTDYKKVKKAKKLLKESGIQYMLAYSKKDKHISSRVNGQYLAIKKFIITAMFQAIKDVHNQCGSSGTATIEAFKIAKAAIEKLNAEVENKK